jgi:predicted N-acetyltransferase YhbS
MNLRPAVACDLDAIYLMGYDAWGGGRPIDGYLAGCRANGKYRQGRWFVATDARDVAVSSLLLWDLAVPGTIARGLGSLATAPEHRRQGHASHLIAAVVADQVARERAEVFFLYADIDPDIYARRGFTALPADLQRHPGSVCMLRYAATPTPALRDAVARHVPRYF